MHSGLVSWTRLILSCDYSQLKLTYPKVFQSQNYLSNAVTWNCSFESRHVFLLTQPSPLQEAPPTHLQRPLCIWMETVWLDVLEVSTVKRPSSSRTGSWIQLMVCGNNNNLTVSHLIIFITDQLTGCWHPSQTPRHNTTTGRLNITLWPARWEWCDKDKCRSLFFFWLLGMELAWLPQLVTWLSTCRLIQVWMRW